MKNLPTSAKLIAGFYLLVVAYWLVVFFGGFRDTGVSYMYQLVFGLIPVLGGISGIMTAKLWGGMKSKLGRSLYFVSLGLLSWGLGQMVWSFYTITGISDVPYPSFADLGYIVAVPLWLTGMANLSRTTGAKYGLRKASAKILVVVLPLVILTISYYLLIVVARGNALFPDIATTLVAAKLFLDIGYPMGDVLILTFSLLVFGLSAGYLGGRYKFPIYALLFGYVVMYAADFSFSFTTNDGSYYNGHWVDLLFPTAMALMAFGVNAIVPPKIKAAVAVEAVEDTVPSPAEVAPEPAPEPTQEPAPSPDPTPKPAYIPPVFPPASHSEHSAEPTPVAAEENSHVS